MKMKLIDKLSSEIELLYPNLYIRYWHDGKPTHYFIGPTNNGVYSELTGKLLKYSIGRSGYMEYHLYIDGKKITKTYNNLVGLTALYNNDPENKTEVDHLYGDKMDNDYRKLEWVTHAENNRRARKTGLNPPLVGENNGTCVYSKEELEECVQLLLNGKTVKEVSELTDTPTRIIYGLIAGKRPDVTSGVKFPDTVYTHKQKNKRATPEEVAEVRRLREQGLTAPVIARRLNIPLQKVYNIYYYKR